MASPSAGRKSSSFGGSARSSLASQKELVALPRHEASQDPFLGRSIRKSFGGQFFFGHVVSIDVDTDSGERHYHVAYEDGDEEHLVKVEVEPLLQAGRISLGGHSSGPMPSPPHGGRSSLASGPAVPSCRPSFSISRAATPRQSGASQAPRPSMAMGGHMPFGGDPHNPVVEDGCPVHWWAAGGAMILLYCVVWCLPSCLSCAVGVGTPGLDLDSFSHFNGADRDVSESPTPAWMLPSNDILLSSLPTPSHSGFDQNAAPEVPSAEPVEEMSAPLPSFRETPATETPVSHFWRYTATEDVTMPGQEPNLFQDDSAEPPSAEEASTPTGAADMGLASFVQLWRSMVETATSVLASFCDLVEIGFSVLAFLVTAGTVLLIGKLFGGPAHGGTGPPLALPTGEDATNPLIGMGGAPGVDASQFLDVAASPVRNDPYEMAAASPHHLQQHPVTGSPFHGSPMVAPGALPEMGSFYVANVGREQRVVKTMELNATKDAVVVKELIAGTSRGGQITFKATEQCFELPIPSLVQGPFMITAGRAPKHISQMFESARVHPPACPTPSRAAEAGNRNLGCDLPSERFKYPSSLRRLVEMGFEDSLELRDVLMTYRGNVDEAIQDFWTE